ncbi:unnamed protein product [Schistocephalus solidus]|uniref:DUF7083 domain-containing protein n=1 Tax=Schistocephalus solidus TaxID=70667 RepID=A0A183SZK9_SCHSO|nr:unnamed protein product [Schistocephalus solidus]
MTLAGAVAACITEFIYNPDSGVAFDPWFKRWEDIFRVEFTKANDVWKVRLLLIKLVIKEHEWYTDLLLPKNPRDFTFDETVK